MTAGTIYDLTALETSGDYETSITGETRDLKFNYCAAVDAGDYAKWSPSPSSSDVIIADDAISPTDASNVEDAAGNVLGVTFEQGSATTCAGDSSKTYSLKTTVTCDAAVTGALTQADFTVTKDSTGC